MSRRIAAFAVAVALCASACGVRLEADPQRIERRDVPYGLLQRDEPGERVSFVIFLISGDRLVAVPRRGPGPLTPELTVTALLQGPTPGELAAGLRSAIPRETKLLGVSRNGDTATVDLGNNILDAENLARAYRQIAATVQELLEASTVRLTAGGDEVLVPDSSTDPGAR